MRRAILLFAALMLGSFPATAQDDSALERGRDLTQWLLGAEIDSLLPRMSGEFRQAVGGRAGMATLTQTLQANFGRELDVREEKVYQLPGRVEYYRISRFAAAPQNDVTVTWAWRADDGVVVGGTIAPSRLPAATEHEDYTTKAALRLPFEGEWFVAWGGRTVHENYHAVAADQRFAYDFYIVRDGATHTGDGTLNTQYFCFGKPILAPAAGVVTSVVDSVADNTPGLMYYLQPAGNHVVIDHGEGEHSVLAHLRRGSVAVAAGQRVDAGERVGECGNSGNSSEPHLHYHLQTGPSFREGVGLPASFRSYRADGRPVDSGEPRRGQKIQSGRKAP